jgi:hypothetical protein
MDISNLLGEIQGGARLKKVDPAKQRIATQDLGRVV